MAGIALPVEPRKRFSWIFKAERPLDRELPLTIDLPADAPGPVALDVLWARGQVEDRMIDFLDPAAGQVLLGLDRRPLHGLESVPELLAGLLRGPQVSVECIGLDPQVPHHSARKPAAWPKRQRRKWAAVSSAVALRAGR